MCSLGAQGDTSGSKGIQRGPKDLMLIDLGRHVGSFGFHFGTCWNHVWDLFGIVNCALCLVLPTHESSFGSKPSGEQCFVKCSPNV